MNARRVAGFLLVTVAVLAFHLVPIGIGDYRVDGALQNIAHVAGFAVLAYSLTQLILKWRLSESESRLVSYVLAILSAFGIALLSETAQIQWQRDANLEDLVLDAWGIATGQLYAIAKGVKDDRSARRVGLVLISVLVLIGSMTTSGYLLLSTIGAQVCFPILARFESILDRRTIERLSATVDFVPASENWPRTGTVALVRPNGIQAYEGITLSGFPSIWTSYKTLSFVISTEFASKGRIMLRIHDASHNNKYDDRFNKSVEVSPLASLVKIPLADIRNSPEQRALDLENVQELTIFVKGGEFGGFYIDDIHLE